MKSCNILVVGSGVTGLSVALLAARCGARVTVCDSNSARVSASGVAAGMLAPTAEALLDPGGARAFEILSAAARRWPKWASDVQISLDMSPAAMVGSAELMHQAIRHLEALDAAFEPLDPNELRRLAPGAEVGLTLPSDWRLEPSASLTALRKAAARADVSFRKASFTGFENGAPRLADGMAGADRVIIAAGYSPGLAQVAPELALIEPIKGQLMMLPSARSPATVLRGDGVYVCPSSRGVIVGATMQPGRDDLDPEPELLAELRARAARLIPGLAGGPAIPAVGIRAATPDGLPLVGASATPGVFLATGMRRNGWLLAPLVAETLADITEGKPSPYAAMLDPRRFDGGGVASS